MMMESSTREGWASYYQAVCYQDIPRLHAGVDGYPEDAQMALSHHLVNQEHPSRYGERSSVWSHESETVMYELGSYTSTKPIARQCQ